MAGWIGHTISKVEIQKLLGRGGMAEVYLGRHTTLNRPVAVKILHGHLSDDETLMARFRSEAQAVASMRHPNIIQVFDFDVAEDQPYIIMELLEGPSLADYLRLMRRSGKTLSPEMLVRVVTYVAAALDYAHAHGIVHRDVKPSNVLLRRESGVLDPAQPLPADAQPVLTDFGVARMANATVRTVSGVIVGTPAYMSPEQVSGQPVDARSDIYSLGVMLYEMVSGRLPFDTEADTPAATLVKHITEAPPPIPEASPAVTAVIFRAMAKDRNERYQKAGDMATDLRAAYGIPITPVDLPSPTPPLGTKPSPVPGVGVSAAAASPAVRPRPSRAFLVVGVVLILIVAVGAGIFFGTDLLKGEDKASSGGGSGTLLTPMTDFGLLGFSNKSADLDQVTLTVQNLDPPPAGMQYEVWLLGGETRRSLGVLTVGADGGGQLAYVAEEGENLLASYGRFEITVEPSPDPNPLPTGDAVYSGAVPPAVLTHVRHLVVSFDGAPGKIGLVIGVMRDARQINEIAQALLAAQEKDDLVEMKRQAEGLVNLIEGEGGEHFGDLDEDGEVFNPGDGFGLLPGATTGYIQSSIEHAKYSAGSAEATGSIIQNANSLEAAAQNLGTWAAQLRDAAMTAIDSSDIGSAEEPAKQLVQLAGLFLRGEDVNGNGMVEPITGEGGAETVYLYASAMADMAVLRGANQLPQPAQPNTTSPNPVQEGGGYPY
jgi:serine/threonine protein kinase